MGLSKHCLLLFEIFNTAKNVTSFPSRSPGAEFVGPWEAS
jgi:hypothetical protein